jgi:lipopolysaccharide/colanic/teichoic acid biosynthesis glycosyltransferase
MSLVGPRPPIPYEAAKYQSWHLRRVLEMKPGITGLWQVHGRSNLDFDDRLKLDIAYIERQSIWMDLQILVRTAAQVFIGEGAY